LPTRSEYFADYFAEYFEAYLQHLLELLEHLHGAHNLLYHHKMQYRYAINSYQPLPAKGAHGKHRVKQGKNG